MITIQSGMLIALGFLAAVLLGLLVAPAFWRRAVRLTTRRIKTTMPLSELEIEADRDRIRAEYAIKMHKLEMLVEQVKLAGARQQIEINRRDARVNMLEGDLERLRARHEEAQNARRVLEQTIADRLPRVEGRLTEAKKVLHAREREIEELTAKTEKQVQALAAARSLNDSQKDEIARLKAIPGRGSQLAGEAELRAEIAELAKKTKEQAQLIQRLQSLSGNPIKGAAGDSGSVSPANGAPELAELEGEIAALRARNDDQTVEIARLKAAIEVFEKNADGEMLGSMRESRLALKARVQSLEAQTVQQSETVAKLRSELAAANERLARQAAHFTGELRRLGGGGPNGQNNRRAAAAARPTLSERVAHANRAVDLDERSVEDASIAAAAADETSAQGSGAPGEGMAPAGSQEAGRASIESDVVAEGRGGGQRGLAQRPRLLDRLAGLSRTS
ncbi:MAG: hypothetical protein R3D44_17010 [Hyphomicrobiaceae bacterium]